MNPPKKYTHELTRIFTHLSHFHHLRTVTHHYQHPHPFIHPSSKIQTYQPTKNKLRKPKTKKKASNLETPVKMAFFTDLKLKLKRSFSKCSNLFSKKPSRSGSRSPGLGDGTVPAKLCLSCGAVWLAEPFQLCNNCQKSPYVLPVFTPDDGKMMGAKEEENEANVEEVGKASGAKWKGKGKAVDAEPTLDNILGGEFPKKVGEGYSWED
ncbi:hypothetical protein L873DRAFT_1845169 [Choiromyces venosus 120613-1]|uniref:Uncharacterized protein n=1 Tax=Choiromyces venosus 120613-1 TaxID=1336337 RepID=A0A3N4JHN2_9PEZI|nr:hypothetical protein L873DRAFT_1845169 [Choiromyces venosus 120613-1]